MLNDCFGNKSLTFQMPRNNVNFEVTPMYTLTQRHCARKRWPWLFGEKLKSWFHKVLILMGEKVCFSSSSYQFEIRKSIKNAKLKSHSIFCLLTS